MALNVTWNLAQYSKILVRATNWVGDAVMSLPALRAVRERFPEAHIAILAKPSVAGLYTHEGVADRIIPYTAATLQEKIRFAWTLRAERFDCAILLQNAFEAALIARIAGIPERIGYDRDARGWLLTRAVVVPKPGEMPRHERYYYLELLRRAGIIESLPEVDAIRLSGVAGERRNVIGISPGAAYGTAKRWLPENFAKVAVMAAREWGAAVEVFGSKGERELCAEVASAIAAEGVAARNLAGETSLEEFAGLAASCRVFITNDSGAMHIASAGGAPTVAIFGATDHTGTGPTGRLARVVREPVECAPCLLRECPIDHRCMTRVTPERVLAEIRTL